MRTIEPHLPHLEMKRMPKLSLSALLAALLAASVAGIAFSDAALAQTTVPAPQASSPPNEPSKAKPKAKKTTAPTGSQQGRTASTPQNSGTTARGGGLNLNLQTPSAKSGEPQGVTSAPGTFAASGPYASQALINRVTGKVKQQELPKSPISLGGAGSSDQNIGPIWAR